MSIRQEGLIPYIRLRCERQRLRTMHRGSSTALRRAMESRGVRNCYARSDGITANLKLRRQKERVIGAKPDAGRLLGCRRCFPKRHKEEPRHRLRGKAGAVPSRSPEHRSQIQAGGGRLWALRLNRRPPPKPEAGSRPSDSRRYAQAKIQGGRASKRSPQYRAEDAMQKALSTS